MVGLDVVKHAAQTRYQEDDDPVEDVAEGETFRDRKPSFKVQIAPDRHCIERPSQ